MRKCVFFLSLLLFFLGNNSLLFGQSKWALEKEYTYVLSDTSSDWIIIDSTIYFRDNSGEMTSKIFYSESFEIHYNERGQFTKHIYTDLNEGYASHIWTRTYDEKGNITSSLTKNDIDYYPWGSKYYYEYDALGRVHTKKTNSVGMNLYTYSYEEKNYGIDTFFYSGNNRGYCKRTSERWRADSWQKTQILKDVVWHDYSKGQFLSFLQIDFKNGEPIDSTRNTYSYSADSTSAFSENFRNGKWEPVFKNVAYIYDDSTRHYLYIYNNGIQRLKEIEFKSFSPEGHLIQHENIVFNQADMPTVQTSKMHEYEYLYHNNGLLHESIKDGNERTVYIYKRYEDVLGIIKPSEDILKIFPVPSSDYISIRLKNEEILELSILNSKNIEVYHTKNPMGISIKLLPKGVYFIKIHAVSDNIYFAKFIKN